MSKVIKPQYYITLEQLKQIEVAEYPQDPVLEAEPGPQGLTEEEKQEIEQLRAMKDRILQDAEEAAELQLQQALQEAAAIKEQAAAEIDEWWFSRRELDEQVEEQARQAGFEAGYQEGLAQVEQAVRSEHEGMLTEAKQILEQAYVMKDQIIKESEPFLIELATAIAEKIIQRELSSNPEWFIGITRSILSRKRDKGIVTLCVAPDQFSYIRDARDELMLSLDPRDELQIIPDASVGPFGCVVRTSFGSIDARVDTQLKGIKLALQQLSMEPVEGEEEE